MEMPRRFNTYCPHCNEHHQHEVEKVRHGRETGMKSNPRDTRPRHVGHRQRRQVLEGAWWRQAHEEDRTSSTAAASAARLTSVWDGAPADFTLQE